MPEKNSKKILPDKSFWIVVSKTNNIKFYFIEACIVERFNRTLKEKCGVKKNLIIQVIIVQLNVHLKVLLKNEKDKWKRVYCIDDDKSIRFNLMLAIEFDHEKLRINYKVWT